MSTPDFPPQSISGTSEEDRLRKDASELVDTARRDLTSAADQVKQEASAIGEEAKVQLADVAQKAKAMAEDQKQLIADQFDGVSSSLDRVAGELEQKDESTAQYVRMVADGASKLTATVRDNSIDDILALAEDFGRKQPVAFMGAAALLGFVASRFLLASPSRRSESQTSSSPSGINGTGSTSISQTPGGYDA